MTRERGKANRGAAARKASVQTHQARVLEIAKWPEWEQEQLRDIAEWDEVTRAEPVSRFFHEGDGDKPHQEAEIEKREDTVHSESSFHEERDEIQQAADIAKWEEAVHSESSSQPVHAEGDERQPTWVVTSWDDSHHSPSSMHPFHGQQDKRESGNTRWIAGGFVAGLLLIGGGIYAYESSTTRLPPPQAVALKNPQPDSVFPARPSNPPALTLPAAPDNLAAPPQTSPEGNSPKPNRAANNSDTRIRPLPPEADDPINAPMTLTPETAPPPQQSPLTGEAAIQQPLIAPSLRQSSEAGRTAFADDPINAPMTLTPETAPPPQPLTPPSQTGLQQPVTPPLVPGQVAPPMPAR